MIRELKTGIKARHTQIKREKERDKKDQKIKREKEKKT